MPDDLPGGGVDVELVQGELEVEVVLLLPVVVAPLVYQVTPQQGLGVVPDPALYLDKIRENKLQEVWILFHLVVSTTTG